MSLRHPFFAGILLISGLSLVALPDPDLFDGRVSPSSAELSSSSGKAIEDEGTVAKQTGTSSESESRDYNNFDGADVGQTVMVGDSKSSNVESVASANASVGTGVQKTETDGLKSTDSQSSAEIQRSFEAFEIGSSSETEAAIEVNRSKELTGMSAKQSDSTVSSEPVTQDSGSDKTVIQEQTKSSGSADFGSDLPSGL